MTLKSVLVTGVTGFIGSALTRRLSEEGVKVFCLVRKGGKDRSHLQSLQGVTLIEVVSFQSSELCKSLEGVTADVIFNLASYGVHPSDCDPEVMIDGNMNVVTGLLLATAKWPLKQFIHIGSCSEYGEACPPEPLTERHPLRPISLYGAAKAASVLYGNALAARLNMPFVTLRLFGVYGAGEAEHRLIPYIVRLLGRDEPADLTPGEQVRDVLHIDDVVEAFLSAAVCQCLEACTAYNVCSGIRVTVREVGEAVARAMNKPLTLLHWGRRPYRPDEPMWILGDSRRFVEATGWRPKVNFLEGVKRMAGATNR